MPVLDHDNVLDVRPRAALPADRGDEPHARLRLAVADEPTAPGGVALLPGADLEAIVSVQGSS